MRDGSVCLHESKKKMAKPMRWERKREREGGSEMGRQSIYVRTWQKERGAEGERTRRMQGSSVRGSVVAMGIGDEGYGGTREERVGRCKRTIKFYGSPELYLSSARPRLSILCRRCSLHGKLQAKTSIIFLPFIYLIRNE